MTRFQVLVILKLAVALQQSKAARIVEFVIAQAQFFRIAQWPPNPFASVRLINSPSESCTFRSPISFGTTFFFTIQEHAGQRGDTKLLDGFAQKYAAHERPRWLEFTGLNDKRIGSSDAGTVENAYSRTHVRRARAARASIP